MKRVTSWRGPYPRHCAHKQHSSFRSNVAAAASRWQHYIRFDRPGFELDVSRFRDKRVTAWTNGQSYNYVILYHENND